MSLRDLIDPDLRPPLEALLQRLPGGLNAIPDLSQRRAVARQIEAEQPPPERDDVVIAPCAVPGIDGGPVVTTFIHRPAAPIAGPDAGICYIHGGGMVMGSAVGEQATASMLCAELGVVVVSVDYRLAPEHPYPAAIHDIYSSLQWMATNPGEGGVDPERIGLCGGSAGGGLAVGSALFARQREGPLPCFVMAMSPMLDDRSDTPSSHEITDLGVWDRATNQEAWSWYLSGMPADECAAPARADDLTAFPPTFIDVGALDLFRDENVGFAQRLMSAGVATELHVYPGSYHASEHIAPDAELSQRMWATRLTALRRALQPAHTR